MKRKLVHNSYKEIHKNKEKRGSRKKINCKETNKTRTNLNNEEKFKYSSEVIDQILKSQRSFKQKNSDICKFIALYEQRIREDEAKRIDNEQLMHIVKSSYHKKRYYLLVGSVLSSLIFSALQIFEVIKIQRLVYSTIFFISILYLLFNVGIFYKNVQFLILKSDANRAIAKKISDISGNCSVAFIAVNFGLIFDPQPQIIKHISAIFIFTSTFIISIILSKITEK